MQQVVYADVLVFLNTVLTFIILLSVKVFSGCNSTILRISAASVIGGFYSLILLVPTLHLLILFISKAAASMLIVSTAFALKRIKQIIKYGTLFLLVSYLYAGVIYAAHLYFNSSFITVNNGTVYYNLSLYSLILISVAVYIVLLFIKKKILRYNHREMIYDLTIHAKGKEIQLKALFDTGNSVKDIYFDLPVIIMNEKNIFMLFGDKNMREDTLSYLHRKVPIRLLPIASISGEAYLPAFTADRAIIRGNTANKTVNNVCVALTKDPLGFEKYQALINEKTF